MYINILPCLQEEKATRAVKVHGVIMEKGESRENEDYKDPSKISI